MSKVKVRVLYPTVFTDEEMDEDRETATVTPERAETLVSGGWAELLKAPRAKKAEEE